MLPTRQLNSCALFHFVFHSLSVDFGCYKPHHFVCVLLSLAPLDIGGIANIRRPGVSHAQPELTPSHDSQRSRWWRTRLQHDVVSTFELPVLCMIGIINMDGRAVKHDCYREHPAATHLEA